MEQIDYEQFIIYLRRIRNYVRLQMKDSLKDFGISRTHGDILLLLLKEKNGYSMTQISTMLSFDNAIITRKVRELEEFGYVLRTGSPKTTRKYCICLTREGKELALKLKQCLQLKKQEFLSLFTFEEQKLLSEVFDLLLHKFIEGKHSC